MESKSTGIEIHTHRARPIPAEAVQRLYDHAGWWPDRSVEDIARVLATGPAVGAWAVADVVGFARAVADGPLRAYIEDVVVQAAYRRRGVGALLVERLLRELAPVETVSLFCAEELTPFYQAHGFRATTQVVMHWRSDHAAQE